MAHVIIPIPDTDLYIIFSTISDTIISNHCTKEEVIAYELDYETRKAVRETIERVTKEFDRLIAKSPRVSYKDAMEMDKDNR